MNNIERTDEQWKYLIDKLSERTFQRNVLQTLLRESVTLREKLREVFIRTIINSDHIVVIDLDKFVEELDTQINIEQVRSE